MPGLADIAVLLILSSETGVPKAKAVKLLEAGCVAASSRSLGELSLVYAVPMRYGRGWFLPYGGSVSGY